MCIDSKLLRVIASLCFLCVARFRCLRKDFSCDFDTFRIVQMFEQDVQLRPFEYCGFEHAQPSLHNIGELLWSLSLKQAPGILCFQNAVRVNVVIVYMRNPVSKGSNEMDSCANGDQPGIYLLKVGVEASLLQTSLRV